MNSPRRLPGWLWPALLIAMGCGLRIAPWTSFDGIAYDESWYRKYVLALDANGPATYPELCAAYLEDGRDALTPAKVPPLRALFVTASWLWMRVAGGEALAAMHRISTLFGCLSLVAAWGFARRLFTEKEALGVLALFACSPLLMHMSQHPLIDGVYAACALFAFWALWESMRPGAHSAWLAALAVSFALLVLAKENAVFPALGFAAIMLLGKADRRHWLAVTAGGLAAVTLLAAAAGGFRAMFEVYGLFIRKVQELPYARQTGDGPWSRYLVDLMIFTPATLCFALGGAFRTLREDRRAAVLLWFLAVTYLAMCNVRYGMNLRYTTIWEFPLRALAVVQVSALTSRLRYSGAAFALSVAVLCAIDLAQYRQFFVTHRLYELPTEYLLRAEKILK